MTSRPSHNRLTYWLLFIVLGLAADLHGQWSWAPGKIYPDSLAYKLDIGTSAPNSLLDVNGDIELSGGSQNFIFSKRGSVLTLHGQLSGAGTIMEVYGQNGDASVDVGFTLYRTGTPSSMGNAEKFRIYSPRSSTSAAMRISSEANRTGTVRPIELMTSGNAAQLKLASNGNVGIGTSSPPAGSKLTVNGKISAKGTRED